MIEKCKHIWGIVEEDIYNVLNSEEIELNKEQIERLFSKMDIAFSDWYNSIKLVALEIKNEKI